MCIFVKLTRGERLIILISLLAEFVTRYTSTDNHQVEEIVPGPGDGLTISRCLLANI